MNEKTYAEDRLRNNDIGDNPYLTLSLIAKYYYWYLGYKKKKIVSLLFEFLSKSYPKYEMKEDNWKVTVDKIAARAGDNKPFEISGVKITKSEMQKINEIHNKTLERLMFTMLCVAKLNNIKNEKNKGWVNLGSKELFQYARISCRAEERDIKIGQLWQMGLLEFSKRNDNLNCRVTIIDDDSDEELFVADFRELGYEYRLYKGENFIRCGECGILTKANKSGTKKYCKDCSMYSPIKTKTIICVDCGKEFKVESKNNQTCRCFNCQNERNIELNRISSRERMRKYRANNI